MAITTDVIRNNVIQEFSKRGWSDICVFVALTGNVFNIGIQVPKEKYPLWNAVMFDVVLPSSGVRYNTHYHEMINNEPWLFLGCLIDC